MERAKKLQEQREKEMVEKQKQQEIAAGNSSCFSDFGLGFCRVQLKSLSKYHQPVEFKDFASNRLLCYVSPSVMSDSWQPHRL